MTTLTFKPKQVTKRLLAVLPPRAREIVTNRFGLGDSSKKQTLEAIGKTYGITRERVRQIENYALNSIRKSSTFQEEQGVFDELANFIDSLGGMVPEGGFLKTVAKDTSTQNHTHLLLVLGESFKKKKEDSEFKHRWYLDEGLSKKIHESLRKLYKNLSDDALIPESELINSFLNEVKDLNQRYRTEEVVRRWLSLSKTIGKNPLGEWGRATSPNVRAKGMRDYAYLAIKQHGSPMHFREVAHSISDLFDKRAHEATCHNELIKDRRFVLVGRGLYALSEWGYTKGIVKDVIREILEKNGPLTREEIVDKVRKERYVKDNTILVNLQDSAQFERGGDGRYILV
jgi:hypothetical protein|tara:strand:+ start:37423 stop:38451 length:1029 start_codon:yes stop_codon:yes gene_type:complete